jgi:hypothetical protein
LSLLLLFLVESCRFPAVNSASGIETRLAALASRASSVSRRLLAVSSQALKDAFISASAPVNGWWETHELVTLCRSATWNIMLERSSDATEREICPVVVESAVSLAMVDSELTLLIFKRLVAGSSDWVMDPVKLLDGESAILRQRRDGKWSGSERTRCEWDVVNQVGFSQGGFLIKDFELGRGSRDCLMSAKFVSM